jgi:hypothetical protein
MRSTFAFVTLSCAAALLFHCGGGDDSSGGAPVSDAGSGSDSPVVGDSGSTDSGPVDSGPPVTRVDVNGLLNGRASDNGPLASRNVVLIDALGVVTKVVSGADGKFQVLGVAAPYDLVAPYEVADAATPATQLYYADLTRPDPVIATHDYANGSFPPPYTATVTFTINACLNCPITFSGRSTGLDFGSADSESPLIGTGAASSYSVTYSWYGGNVSSTANFHAGVKSVAGAFIAADQITGVTMSLGGTTALGALTGAALGTSNIVVTSTLPAGYTAVSPPEMNAYYADSAHAGYSYAASGVSATLATPDIAGTIVETQLDIAGAQGTANAFVYQPFANALTATFNLPAPSVPLTPTNSALDVTDTQTMTWSALSTPALYTIELNDGNEAYYQINTSSTSFDLGRLTKAGIPLRGATVYHWHIDTATEWATDDAYAVPARTGFPGYPLSQTLYNTASLAQPFTTK